MHIPEWMTAISSLLLVCATIVYVYFTYQLTKETTKLRELETTPFISIYVFADLPIKMIIENIGKAPAYDVQIEIEAKFVNYFMSGFNENVKEIAYFSPNQQFTVLLKSYRELEKADFESIPIRVKYRSKDGRNFEDTFYIKWKHLDGMIIEKDYLEEIKKELEKVHKSIGNFANTINRNGLYITQKLKILEFEEQDDEVQIIFSDGFVTKIEKQNCTIC